MKIYTIVSIGLLTFFLQLPNFTVAQKKVLRSTVFNTIAVKKTAVVNSRFELKDNTGKKFSDTSSFLIKDKDNRDRFITAGQYNNAMDKFQRYINSKGYSLAELENQTEPIFSNNLVKRTNFSSAKMATAQTIDFSKAKAISLKTIVPKVRKLKGVDIDLIPAYKLNKDFVKSFRLKNTKKIMFNSAQGEYYLSKTPFLTTIFSNSATAPKVNTVEKQIPLLRSGDDTELSLGVSLNGRLKSVATAFPINKDAEDVTLADIEATNSTYEVSAALDANGHIGDELVNVFSISAKYKAYSKANTNHTSEMDLIVGGQEFAIAPMSYSDKTTTITTNYLREVEVPILESRVSILVGYIGFEVGVRGSVGLQVDGEMTPTSSALFIEPSVNCGLYARAAVGIGLDIPFVPDEIVKFSPFVQANLNFVDATLSNYAEASLNWAQDWSLNADVSSRGTVQLLNGELFAGVDISYWKLSAGFTGVSARKVTNRFQSTIWKSNGIAEHNRNFIELKEQPMLFSTW